LISISRIQRPLKACFRLLYDDDDDESRVAYIESWEKIQRRFTMRLPGYPGLENWLRQT